MITKKRQLFFLVILVLLPYSLSFAQTLSFKEAANYFNEGVKLQKEGSFDAATVAYHKTLLLDPGNLKYRKFIINNIGVMQMFQGDIEKAEAMFIEALRIDPGYRPAQLNLGLIYDRQGNRLKALEFWAKVFDIEGQKPKECIIEEQQQIENK